MLFVQILTRRLRFRLERAPGEATLIDHSGRNLKMEPLTTIAALERYLLKMVSWQPKRWWLNSLHQFIDLWTLNCGFVSHRWPNNGMTMIAARSLSSRNWKSLRFAVFPSRINVTLMRMDWYTGLGLTPSEFYSTLSFSIVCKPNAFLSNASNAKCGSCPLWTCKVEEWWQ